MPETPNRAPHAITRFEPPGFHANAIVRHGLLARLQEARACTFVALHAPAGYGKTTLLIQWRRALMNGGVKVAWLRAAPGDALPERFCAALCEAFRFAAVSASDDLHSLLEAPTGVEPAALVAVLVNAIARSGERVQLVLDDFQHAAGPATHAIVQALLDDAPDNLRIAVASRCRTDLRLARLRAMDQVLELDASALAFNAAESRLLLSERLGDAAAARLAEGFFRRTEGWPIGLQILALAARQGAHGCQQGTRLPDDCPELGAYIAENVTSCLSASEVEQLGVLSVASRFDADLARALLGPQAGALLASLAAGNLLLPCRDAADTRQWMRCHPLVAGHLRRRTESGSADTSALHRIAAAFFGQADYPIEASRHALLAGDMVTFGDLLARDSSTREDLPALRHLHRWLREMPREVLTTRSRCLTRIAWACVLSQLPAQAEHCVEALSRPDRPLAVAGHVRLLRAATALLADDVIACEAALPTVVAPGWHPKLRSLHAATMISALARLGRFEEAQRQYHVAVMQTACKGHDELTGMVKVAAAWAQWYEGQPAEAEKMAAHVLAGAPAAGRSSSIAACHARLLLAELCLERDNLDAARAAIDGVEPMLRFGPMSARISAALTRARLLRLEGSPQRALDLLEREEEAFRSEERPRGIAAMLAEQVCLLAESMQLRPCESKVIALDVLASSCSVAGPAGDEVVFLADWSAARLALLTRRPHDALRRAEAAGTIARQYGRPLWAVRANVLRALALADLGRQAESLELAHATLATGCRMGLVHTFYDGGAAWGGLLLNLSHPDDAVMRSYCRRIVAVTGRARRVVPGAADAQESNILTPRECQIVELVREGKSNKRIALELRLSTDTVKWYLKNVFLKLGVSSRYEAALAARPLAQTRSA